MCRTSLIRKMVAILVCYLAVVAVLQVEAKEPESVICDYTNYLDGNPLERAAFISMKNKMYDIMIEMADPDVRFRNQDTFSKSPKRVIDEASQKCLGCHDEMGALKRYGSNASAGFDNKGMTKMAEAHPVGLLYERRTIFRNDLNTSADFPPGVILVNGRVSCVTCHDPLNPKSNHFAAGNTRSALCFVCHKM